MTAQRLSYALITPAKDEVENLARLAECVTSQTLIPAAWIIVDNGSSDGTLDLARRLAGEHPWISVVSAPSSDKAAPGPPVVRAFNAGVRTLEHRVDVVVKLDADVSFETDYFERLVGAFGSDERLGIASGVCYEQEGGAWVPRHVTGDHVRGATRAYRASCLDAIGPLPEAVGWDGVDEMKAGFLGWRTACIDGLPFYHHRSVGARDGAPSKRWIAEGGCAHYMGYRLPYLVVRTFGRALRDRDPFALAMLWGYIAAALRRTPRYDDPQVRAYLRRQQSVRYLPLRVRESFGRR
jgi:glycosyltransferase involved in cell wall biosynthesis